MSLPLGAGNGSGSVLRDVSGTVEAAKNTTHVEAILLGDCGVVLRVVEGGRDGVARCDKSLLCFEWLDSTKIPKALRAAEPSRQKKKKLMWYFQLI